MAHLELIPRTPELAPYRLGTPQQAGPMTVLPLFGEDRNGKYAAPLTGLKLGGVRRGYGNVELQNPSNHGVVIVPLHMGYIQDQAQNHALCRSAFVAAGQTVLFEDACCVQQSQGGYLESREQWFFILPLHLREEALQRRGERHYGKLWPAIARLNDEFGLANRGHLELLLCGRRAYLTQYQSRFELLPGQTGALFFLGDRLVGVESAPSAAYFQEVWMPLVCFCYGAAAMAREGDGALPASRAAFSARSLAELREQLEQSRLERTQRVRQVLAQVPPEPFEWKEEERFLGLCLYTVGSSRFVGQVVEEKGQIVYASLTARRGALVK
jgi:hypothetical protein